MSSTGAEPSCGARVRVCSPWSTMVAVVEPTTIWRPMNARVKVCLSSVSVVVAGTASTAGVLSVAGTAAVPATCAYVTPSAPLAPAPISWLTEDPTNGIGTSRPPPVIVVRSLPALLKASRTPPKSDVGLSGSKLSALSRSASAGFVATTLTSVPWMPSASLSTVPVRVSSVDCSPSRASSESSTLTSIVASTAPSSFWEKTSSVDSVVRIACWRTCSTNAGTGIYDGDLGGPLGQGERLQVLPSALGELEVTRRWTGPGSHWTWRSAPAS